MTLKSAKFTPYEMRGCAAAFPAFRPILKMPSWDS